MKTGDRAASEARVRKGTWQALGWLSGLGLLVIPVFVAGVLSTAGGVLETLLSSELSEPQAWDAERTFPWLYVAALVVGLGWVTYGSVRIPRVPPRRHTGHRRRTGGDGRAPPPGPKSSSN